MTISLKKVSNDVVTPPKAPSRPECLTNVTFLSPSTLQLEFANACFSLEIERLEMPEGKIQWESAAASSAGDAMTVMGFKGELISIDSGTLRYLVDQDYAVRIDGALTALQPARDELQELARKNQPPPEWYAQPEQDLRLESWK